MDAITVSIIICTRNRADSLKLTLESIGDSAVPAGWNAELVVVDNGSTDATAAVVAAVRFPGLPVRYVMESRKGKGHALNTGVSSASGQILLFTDDDVRVPRHWIRELSRPLVDGTADAVAGGVIFPVHIAAALAHPLFASRRSWFGSTESLDRHSPHRMVGANMAFHRRVLERVPGMDVDLGPGALGFAEETLFSRQLLQAGYRLRGALEVAVEHHFDQGRLTPYYMIDLARRMGHCEAFIFHHWEHKNPRLAVPRWLLGHLRVKWRRLLDRRSWRAPTGVSDKRLSAEYTLAFHQEFLRQRRRPHKYPRRGLAPHPSSG